MKIMEEKRLRKSLNSSTVRRTSQQFNCGILKHQCLIGIRFFRRPGREEAESSKNKCTDIRGEKPYLPAEGKEPLVLLKEQ